MSLRSEFPVVMSVTSSACITEDVRFVVTSCCLEEGSCLIYVIHVCLSIVMSNTYCVDFLSSSCGPYVAIFSGLSIFDCPFRYSLTFN